MEKILFEKEVCDFLNIPSIPLKEWNQKDSFKDGVAVTSLTLGRQAYAVCSFDKDNDLEPRIKKVFAQEPFGGIEKVFVVPSYMNTGDIDKADLDEQSKEAAKRLEEEARVLVEQNGEDKSGIFVPKNEYFFDHIHNDDEAIAFITAYNRDNGIKGAIPTKHDTLVMRLGVIYSDITRKNKKQNK